LLQFFFPAIELHFNAVAAAILSEPGVEWLVDVPDDAGLSF